MVGLLVVVAIVSLLLALGMTTVPWVAETSRRGVCAQNLKQCGMGAVAWASDHNSHMPPGQVATDSPGNGAYAVLSRAWSNITTPWRNIQCVRDYKNGNPYFVNATNYNKQEQVWNTFFSK
jgi:hypothetical protein